MKKLLILFLALCAATIGAQTYILEESYLISGDEIRASHIIQIDAKNDFVIDRFDGRGGVQYPIAKLKRIFATHGVIVDAGAPIISFYFADTVDIDLIEKMVIEKFLEVYPKMQINHIAVRPLSFTDISHLEIAQIDISQNALKRSKGTFVVWFGDENTRVKRLFFSYEIDAVTRVLRASRLIPSGALLSQENTEETLLAFDQFSSVPIDQTLLEKVMAKARMQKGEVITQTKVKLLPDVEKNQKIRVEVVSNGVKLSFWAIAQKTAQIGERIEVKDDSGKKFWVRITGKDLAVID
ncbi:hypothetical protein AGMMS50229_12570 [Campylobacterota bacterium]|nr:hypothetical protein AGMMS50229_12570 [Campylobacterota bacterium]